MVCCVACPIVVVNDLQTFSILLVEIIKYKRSSGLGLAYGNEQWKILEKLKNKFKGLWGFLT